MAFLRVQKQPGNPGLLTPGGRSWGSQTSWVQVWDWGLFGALVGGISLDERRTWWPSAL